MIITQKTNFKCIIPEQNKQAFYELIAGQDLFGFIIIRYWGRLGTKGQPKLQQRFLHEEDMLEEYDRIHRERIRHHYNTISIKDGTLHKKAGAGVLSQSGRSGAKRPLRSKHNGLEVQNLF